MVELVGDVVVGVPYQQVRIAAIAETVVRTVHVVAFDHDVVRGRNGSGDQVALVRIAVDDDIDLRRGVAVHDVVGQTVEIGVRIEILAEVRMKLTVAVLGGDVIHDAGGGGGHRRTGDLL